jgi:preprotein translocase subunit SecA
VALEDELMQRFGGDRIKNVMNWTGLNDDEPLENKLITKSITSAQVKVEGHHFDMRKHLLNFDDVLNQQRSVIYEQRSRILAGHGLRERALDMLQGEFDRLTTTHLQARHADDWDVDGFLAGLRQICPLPLDLDAEEKVLQLRREPIEDILEEHAEKLFDAKEQSMGSDNMETLVRLLLLKSIDTHWVNHLTHMENLRTGVGLQAVGQRDPLTVYRSEGQRAFAELTRQMQREVTHTVFHVTLAPEAPTPPPSVNAENGGGPGRRDSRAPVSPMAAMSSGRTAPPRAGRKIGRNSKCPCGSGKKYKRCCGAAA